MKSTVPVGFAVAWTGVSFTVAVNVTLSLKFDGLRFDPKVVVVSNKSTGVFTVLVLSGLPAKPPVTVPKFVTCGVPGGTPVRFGGLFTVTWKLIVIESPL